MDLHVVSGFLGSGKTTAIVGALQVLPARGLRVGVITNDKGRYLVDTAFLAGAGVPTAEVPGGCFRCNYGDFQDCIRQLRREARLDVLFAESVGSCVDLVGPVLLPLAALSDPDRMRITYSVFVDIRLLRRRLLGLPFPFSDNISYIFDKQLEEANLLVLNKADLLTPDVGTEVVTLARRRFPDKMLLLQNSLTPSGVEPWLDALQAGHALPLALDLDYGPYIAGAAELAWFDERLTFVPPQGQEREMLVRLVVELLEALRAADAVAHLKLFVQAENVAAKLSFTSLDEPGWEAGLPDFPGGPVTLIINARVQMPVDRLHDRVSGRVHAVLRDAGAAFQTAGATALAPEVPTQ